MNFSGCAYRLWLCSTYWPLWGTTDPVALRSHSLQRIFCLFCTPPLRSLSLLPPPPSSSSFLPVERQPGRCQEAAAGRDVAPGGCREPPADPEGGTGVPEEHLQRGSRSLTLTLLFLLSRLSQPSYFSSSAPPPPLAGYRFPSKPSCQFDLQV